MNSKIVSIVALFCGLVSHPLYASDSTDPFINTLISPTTHVDPGTWFLLCSGLVGLIIMRKLVR